MLAQPAVTAKELPGARSRRSSPCSARPTPRSTPPPAARTSHDRTSPMARPCVLPAWQLWQRSQVRWKPGKRAGNSVPGPLQPDNAGVEPDLRPPGLPQARPGRPERPRQPPGQPDRRTWTTSPAKAPAVRQGPARSPFAMAAYPSQASPFNGGSARPLTEATDLASPQSSAYRDWGGADCPSRVRGGRHVLG